MKKIIMICASIFLLGLIITVLFYVFPIFGMTGGMILWGMRAGLVIMGASAVILIIILILEGARDNKKLKNDIKEEDLRP